METTGTYGKPSPLINIAAVALIIASLAAVGAVTGIIPSAHAQRQDATPVQEKSQEAGQSGE